MLSDLESLFLGHAQVFIREEAEGILSRLGDAVKGTILELGDLIRGEMSKKTLHQKILKIMSQICLKGFKWCLKI
jgi:exocyst complex component 7